MSVHDFYLGRDDLGRRARRERRSFLIEALLLVFIAERDSWPPLTPERLLWTCRVAALRSWR